MIETLVAVIVTGVVSIITTLISNNATRNLITYRLDKVEDRVDDLSKKVEAHNNFGLEIREIKTRLNALEQK